MDKGKLQTEAGGESFEDTSTGGDDLAANAVSRDETCRAGLEYVLDKLGQAKLARTDSQSPYGSHDV